MKERKIETRYVCARELEQPVFETYEELRIHYGMKHGGEPAEQIVGILMEYWR